MKIKTVQIANFKSIKNLTIQMSDILALVGQNNAGKSNILKAVDLFFEPSPAKIGEESFYQGDVKLPIEITWKEWRS